MMLMLAGHDSTDNETLACVATYATLNQHLTFPVSVEAVISSITHSFLPHAVG